jgi:hypothetical protein
VRAPEEVRALYARSGSMKAGYGVLASPIVSRVFV